MDNLVAWWMLNDGPDHTTVADSSGHGRDGKFPSVTGHAASSDPKWYVDHDGGICLRFDGTDYVRCGGAKNQDFQGDPNDLSDCSDPPTWADFEGESFTITAWVKEVQFNNWATFIGKGERAYKLQKLFGGVQVHWAFPRTPAGGQAGGFVRKNRWHHIGAMWDNEQEHASIWVNGTRAATLAWVDNVTDPTNDNYDPAASGRHMDNDCEVTLGARLNEDWGTPADEDDRVFKKCGCPTPTGEPYVGTAMDGMLSDVRMYNRLLAEDEMLYLATLGLPQATQPEPRNESSLDASPQSLSWSPGEDTVSETVYLGESLDDVTAGTPGTRLGSAQANTLMLNQELEVGKTYYWRVEGAKADAVVAGDVWTFVLKSTQATAPSPPDGMKWVDPNTALTWEPGLGAQMNVLYFSQNRANVENGVAGKNVADSTYDPAGDLADNTTYYWRVDSQADGAIVAGPVWSFKTKGPDVGGLLGSYFNNQQRQGNRVLTRIEGPIAFSWQNESPEPGLVTEDDFSVRWEGFLEVPITDTYMIVAVKDDAAACWIDGEVVFYDMLASWGTSETKGFVELEAGKHEIVVEYFDVGWSAEIELLWSTDSIALQRIPIQALSAPVKAGGPRPAHGAVEVAVEDLTLMWSAGNKAAQHRVYFGTEQDVVAAGDPSVGRGLVNETQFAPTGIQRGQTYYWRVDAVNDVDPESPWVGDVWGFTTAPFVVLDNFDNYGTESPYVVLSKWQDQLGLWDIVNGEWIELGPGNGTGALIGGTRPAPYVETVDVHGPLGQAVSVGQSLPLAYDHNDVVHVSEGTRWFDPPKDFTEDDGSTLGLWFKGRQPPTSSVTYADGLFTLEVAGTDIAGARDEFIFAYKDVVAADLIARVDAQENTNPWAKAGVMLRSGLADDSAYIYCFVTPLSGAVVELRTSDGSVQSGQFGQVVDVNAPHWVRVQLSNAGQITCWQRADGQDWQEMLQMPNTFLPLSFYAGLAMTSHDSAQVNTTVFSNVTLDGAALGLDDVAAKEIGVPFNTPSPIYVTLKDAAGAEATVSYPENPDGLPTNILTWTEWPIALSDFTDQNPALDLTRITRLKLGIGPDPTGSAAGVGEMLYDDIRIYNSQWEGGD